MLILAMASIATLLAMRHLWVNEQLLNAQADQLRTQHHAEAMLPVALADILGDPINHDGTPNLRHNAGNAQQNHAFFPNSQAEYDLLRQRLPLGTCNTGICAPRALDVPASTARYWKTQTASATPVGKAVTPYGDNTAWYWVEVFPQLSASTANATPTTPFIYRITTLAKGVMPGSSTVLQAIWVRDTPTSTTGQWHSWHVLHD